MNDQIDFHPSPGSLSPGEMARYSRHMVLPEVGRDGQEKLRRAKVLVVGAGGLGSPVSLYLTAAGIGTLGLADFDRIEAHNLQRQILHDTPSVGQLKTDSALRRLRALNPHVHVVAHPEGITVANAMDLFSRYDLIVEGTDHFGIRYLNNDAAFLARRPLVYGSILRFEGQVSLFHPASGGPCYRCLFPRPPAPGTVPNCQEAGVLGALCGIVGSLQAMEALKYLLGIGDSLKGRLMVCDALGARWRNLRIKPDPTCPLCGTNPEIRKLEARNYEMACPGGDPVAPDRDPDGETPMEIDVLETRRLLAENPEEALLLDVREPFEWEIANLSGSLFIPMGEVPARLDELPRHKRILVLCHHGGRSLQVAHYLKSKGYDRVSNVKGGIDDWSRRCDPQIRRY